MFLVQNRSTFLMSGLVTCRLVSIFDDNVESCITAGSHGGIGSLRSRKIVGFEDLEMQNTASVEYNFDQRENFTHHANVLIFQLSFLESQTSEPFVHLK